MESPIWLYTKNKNKTEEDLREILKQNYQYVFKKESSERKAD